jgi:transposase
MYIRQYLPFERMSEFFSDVCNLKLKQGTLCTLLKGFAQKAQPAYELIAQKVENEKVVGGDETGAKVNEKRDRSGLSKAKSLLILHFQTTEEMLL